MRGKVLTVGQRIVLDLTRVTVPGDLKAFSGKKFNVSAVKWVGAPNNRDNFKSYQCYYELEGCVSKYGVPWAIHPDWCIPLEED